MGTASAGRGWFGGHIVSVVFSFGALAAAASAQDAAPCAAAPAPPTGIAAPASPVAGTGSEAERLAERRSALDRRREALARERARLLAVDRPAGPADIELWRDCTTRGNALEKDLKVLQALATVLTPEVLGQVPTPETSVAGAFKTDVGWARARLQVALRNAPDGTQGMETLEAGDLVVRLASGGAWSVIATAFGIGFVPSSQLQGER